MVLRAEPVVGWPSLLVMRQLMVRSPRAQEPVVGWKENRFYIIPRAIKRIKFIVIPIVT